MGLSAATDLEAGLCCRRRISGHDRYASRPLKKPVNLLSHGTEPSAVAKSLARIPGRSGPFKKDNKRKRNMNRHPKTPKSVYVTLGVGFALGAISMVLVGNTKPFSVAYGDAPGLQSFAPRTISAPNRESLEEVRNLDNFYTNLASFVMPAVVDIQSSSGRQLGPNGERMPASGGEGSGFILRPDGYIVTNDHVVDGFQNVTVRLKDGREFPGKVLRAHDSDIAVVKIEATNLPTLAFGDSDKLKPGQMAMAVGSPFTFQQSVTFGHISATGRDRTEIEGRFYPDMIQTDTAINMGNSGGPLTNIDGQVIGLNTAIYSPSGASAGIGFAIPSNEVRLIADRLIEDGKVVRSQMGLYPVNLTDYQKSQKHLTGGALVQDVPEGQPAGMAGIKKGDVIVRIGHTAVNGQMDLRDAMLTYKPGTIVDVELIRDGEHKTFHVKLEQHKEQPEQTQQPMAPGQQWQFQVPRGFGDGPEDFFKDFPGMPFGNQQPHSRSVPSSPDGKPHLGVTVSNLTDDVRSQYSIPASVKGAIVADVQPGSVADNIGLQPGDVIQNFGGKEILGADDLTRAMSGVKSGDSRHIRFSRYTQGSPITSESDVSF